MTEESNNNQNDQPTEEPKPSDETQIEYREISEEELRKIFEDSKKLVESYRNLINNQNDRPTEEQQPPDESQPEYREISEDELNKILIDHKKWLESEKKEGKRADLTSVNIQNVNLGKVNLAQATMAQANLQGAYLWETDLQEADLQEANFQQADLGHANLQKANLLDAKLQKADLYKTKFQQAKLNNANFKFARLEQIQGLSEATMQYANFEGATGLLGNEFAQADVTGTKLPDDIKEFKALDIVEKTSQNARKIFFAMLLGCVYSWLTIATTTDVRLLTNSASSPLPIIGTEIPIAWFYIAAPLVLICLYFYFHLYLDNLWEGLASLPAIFPDGKRLDERAYPWLLNTLVRKHFKRLKKRSFIARMKEWITIFLAWWVVPITMIAFWLRYIPKHDWIGTIFHIGLIVISVAFAIIFYRLCSLTLKAKTKVHFQITKLWKDRRFYYGVSVVLVCVIFSFLSHGSIDGVRPPFEWEKRKVNFKNIMEVVPWAFKKIGYNVIANFEEERVSEIPSNYGEIAKEERLNFVKGANLKNANLNYADMYRAFLVKANLSGALLRYANISYANLQFANLSKADLEKADLYRANLQGADLSEANLKQADLMMADLQKTDGLTTEQLSKVKSLYNVWLDPRLGIKMRNCCPQLFERPKYQSEQNENVE